MLGGNGKIFYEAVRCAPIKAESIKEMSAAYYQSVYRKTFLGEKAAHPGREEEGIKTNGSIGQSRGPQSATGRGILMKEGFHFKSCRVTNRKTASKVRRAIDVPMTS